MRDPAVQLVSVPAETLLKFTEIKREPARAVAYTAGRLSSEVWRQTEPRAEPVAISST